MDLSGTPFPAFTGREDDKRPSPTRSSGGEGRRRKVALGEETSSFGSSASAEDASLNRTMVPFVLRQSSTSSPACPVCSSSPLRVDGPTNADRAMRDSAHVASRASTSSPRPFLHSLLPSPSRNLSCPLPRDKSAEEALSLPTRLAVPRLSLHVGEFFEEYGAAVDKVSWRGFAANLRRSSPVDAVSAVADLSSASRSSSSSSCASASIPPVQPLSLRGVAFEYGHDVVSSRSEALLFPSFDEKEFLSTPTSVASSSVSPSSAASCAGPSFCSSPGLGVSVAESMSLPPNCGNAPGNSGDSDLLATLSSSQLHTGNRRTLSRDAERVSLFSPCSLVRSASTSPRSAVSAGEGRSGDSCSKIWFYPLLRRGRPMSSSSLSVDHPRVPLSETSDTPFSSSLLPSSSHFPDNLLRPTVPSSLPLLASLSPLCFSTSLSPSVFLSPSSRLFVSPLRPLFCSSLSTSLFASSFLAPRGFYASSAASPTSSSSPPSSSSGPSPAPQGQPSAPRRKRGRGIRFFPAFPVHRCRGVSFTAPETGEKVCYGQFDEGAGILLVSPEVLDSMSLASRSPFFDGFVLRQMTPNVVQNQVHREVSAFLAAAAKLGKGDAASQTPGDKETGDKGDAGDGQEAKSAVGGTSSSRNRTNGKGLYVKKLSGSLTTPQLAAPILTELEQNGRCSVPVQFIEFKRGKEKDLNLCVGDCYWLGLKIPLQACNPFLLSRQEGMLEYYTGTPSVSPPEASGGTDGGLRNPQDGDRRRAAGGPGNNKGEAERDARMNADGGKEKSDKAREEDELWTPRGTLEDVGNHVMEMCKRAAEAVPSTVSSVAGKVQEAFPRSAEEAMDRGKGWVKFSHATYERLTTHAMSVGENLRVTIVEFWRSWTGPSKGGGGADGEPSM
ncbi:hypothetical protein TGCAST_309920 [Toxoplasma gondii CAST]|uniref:Uncharacterized protein n=1 Tax=Toxoplasma gondii CAST TaxID=943122 RepID=A0A3R7Z989_TOXGO|nr:hypothetical protein TGCAST_309920 [Toxoplasma gondii CAST]